MVQQLHFPEPEDLRQVPAAREQARVKSRGHRDNQRRFLKRDSAGHFLRRSYLRRSSTGVSPGLYYNALGVPKTGTPRKLPSSASSAPALAGLLKAFDHPFPTQGSPRAA